MVNLVVLNQHQGFHQERGGGPGISSLSPSYQVPKQIPILNISYHDWYLFNNNKIINYMYNLSGSPQATKSNIKDLCFNFLPHPWPELLDESID